jgi:hypothetical protein
MVAVLTFGACRCERTTEAGAAFRSRDLLQVMNRAVRFTLRVWNSGEMQDGTRERTIDAFDANTERLGLPAAALQGTQGIASSGGAVGIEPGIERIAAQLGLGLSEQRFGMLIDFKDDAGLVGQNDGDGTALQQCAELGLHAAELFFMTRVLGGILNADKQTAARQRDGMKLEFFEETVRRGERHGACELAAPDTFTPCECDLLAMFFRRTGVSEPAFDGLIFFERTPEQLGQTLVLKHRNATFIQNEYAAGNAFEIAAQARLRVCQRCCALR